MNKHLELLQWCIDNNSEHFPISYNFNIGMSWIQALHGDIAINCIEEDEVDSVITRLNDAKKENTPEAIKQKRKQELLKELAELEGES